MAATLGPRWPQDLDGGSPALDFVNTLDWRGREQRVETLHEYRDLIRFGLAAQVVGRAEAAQLVGWSAEHAATAARTLARAIALREAIAAIFLAQIHGREIPAASLDALAAECRAAQAARGLVAGREGVRWEWKAGLLPERPLLALALEAERLLVRTAGPPVRECEGTGCGWLFLDTSRSRKRRWCSMAACGNRAKARRFYQRTKGA